MPAYHYYQKVGGEEVWQAVPAAMLPALQVSTKPMFVTIAAVSHLLEGLPSEEHDKLKYLAPYYLDWDGEDIGYVAEKALTLLTGLQQQDLDMDSVRIFATGGRGFHVEIPLECFVAKIPKAGIAHLPVIFKQMAFDMAVDTLDLRVYSTRRGRMWRQPNVQRSNGKYKVQITFDELTRMTPQIYDVVCSQPRDTWTPKVLPRQNLALTLAYETAAQSVATKLAKRKKKNTDASVLRGREMPSIKALMAGRGIKEGTGFHPIAMQLGVLAEGLGWDEARLVQECEELIQQHQGDGNRYNTPERRREEIRRMHRYMSDNPCYELSIGALKQLLNHPAPDLDGIPVGKEEIEEAIRVADEAGPEDPNVARVAADLLMEEYSDVAGGVDLTKYGVYIDTDNGKRRICAISFDKVHILRDVMSGQVSCYEADVLVNGKFAGRQPLELDVFAGLQSFNRFAGRMAHAMQGADQHVRALMMRVAEKAVKEGKVMYVAKREGLDVINIPGHDNEALRAPFLIWADGRGVIMEPRAAATGVSMSFQGFPDPRGNYRTDLGDAPRLAEWLDVEGSEAKLKTAMHNLFTCQRPDVIGNLIGWYTAAFYRMLFDKAYDKFPLLHVNGAAGGGKCWGVNTPILMADGSVKLVQDIVVGDKLLGPDGGVRNVLALGRGREQMYRVTQEKGDDYVVNESHILALRNIRTLNKVHITVREYLAEPRHWRIRQSGWRVPNILRGISDIELSAIEVAPIGEGDYYGFQIDGDHLLMLGDTTVQHNTELNSALLSFYYYNQEPKQLTPQSTVFAIQQHLAGSASVPLMIDEYKPHEMTYELHNKLKLLFRDAYNNRDVMRGGGDRNNDDYRQLHSSQLSAPVLFIGEVMEEEPAVMERVVLVTIVRPPSAVALRWSARFSAFKRDKQVLAILGQYIASSIVQEYSLDKLQAEFGPLYEEAKAKYMLTEADIDSDESEEVLRNKQGAKERTVFNFTVARFGLLKFRDLLTEIFGAEEFAEAFTSMDEAIYSRMKDLMPATQAEYLKVLNTLATMSYQDADIPSALVPNRDYAFINFGGKDAIEFSMRQAYHRYRVHMKSLNYKPLFSGDQAFLHAMKDSAALLAHGPGKGSLQVAGGTYIFDLAELRKLGVEEFKTG